MKKLLSVLPAVCLIFSMVTVAAGLSRFFKKF